MNRRSFLSAILAAGVAPYVVTTAGVLMPVRQRNLYTLAELIGAIGPPGAAAGAKTLIISDGAETRAIGTYVSGAIRLTTTCLSEALREFAGVALPRRGITLFVHDGTGWVKNREAAPT